MMISKVRGRFRTLVGTILVPEDPEQSSVEATIDAASIDTGDPNRDAHLRAADFLDVERYPTITYRSTAVRPAGNKFAVERCVDGARLSDSRARVDTAIREIPDEGDDDG